MSNRYVDDELQRIHSSAMEREQERSSATRHNRNIAAVVDFTSKLLQALDYSLASSTRLPSKSGVRSYEKYTSPPKDFKGTIAGDMFRTRFSLNTGKRNSSNGRTFKV